MFAYNMNPVKRFKRLTIPILAALIRIVASRARGLHHRHWPPAPVERRDPAAAAAASQTAKETPSPSSSPTEPPLDMNQFVVNLDGVEPIEATSSGYYDGPGPVDQSARRSPEDLAIDLEWERQMLQEARAEEVAEEAAEGEDRRIDLDADAGEGTR